MKIRQRLPEPTFEDANIERSFDQLHLKADVEFILKSNERVNKLLLENGYTLWQVSVKDELGVSSAIFPHGLDLQPTNQFSCGNSTVFHYKKDLGFGNSMHFELDWNRSSHSFMLCEMTINSKKLLPMDAYLRIKIENIYDSQLTAENLMAWETILVNIKKCC